MTMTDRTYLSIGEVLNLLQEEFADITISKIRFLESQGLLNPERTPSGYRKFYEADVERLRWILRQQKDHFLPLKVIKDRLASGEIDEPSTAWQAPPSPKPVPEVTPKPVARSKDRLLGSVTVPTEANSILDSGLTGVSLTADELLHVAGLNEKSLKDLERYGLIVNRTLGGTVYYDEDAVIVAKLAAAFLAEGVEARHLRMYKVSAEREAGVFEQLVMPLLKQRNPGARLQASGKLGELAGLGGKLRAAMLRQALSGHLEGT